MVEYKIRLTPDIDTNKIPSVIKLFEIVNNETRWCLHSIFAKVWKGEIPLVEAESIAQMIIPFKDQLEKIVKEYGSFNFWVSFFRDSLYFFKRSKKGAITKFENLTIHLTSENG